MICDLSEFLFPGGDAFTGIPHDDLVWSSQINEIYTVYPERVRTGVYYSRTSRFAWPSVKGSGYAIWEVMHSRRST